MRGFIAKACGLLVSAVWIGAAFPAMAQEMTFKVLTDRAGCGTCVWLQASGEITADSSARFKSFLQEQPFVSVVQIDSVGGNLGAALEMGELVRSRNLAMVVGGASVRATSSGDQIASRVAGQCASACVFVLAAGRERSQVAGSAIGVHQFSGGADGISGAQGLDVGQRVTGTLIAYLARMGVDPAMLAAASSASPNDIHVLSNNEALRFKLLTSAQEQYSAAATGRTPYNANVADPFGDSARIAPASRDECGVARFSRRDGNFSTTQLQEMNRYARDVCEEYFDAIEIGDLKECRGAWGPAQDAIDYVTANKHLGMSPQYQVLPGVALEMMHAAGDCRSREFEKSYSQRREAKEAEDDRQIEQLLEELRRRN